MPARTRSVARLWNRAISQTFVHNCSQSRELFSQHVPRLFCAYEQNSQIFHAALSLKFADDRFRDEFVRLKIDMQVKIFRSEERRVGKECRYWWWRECCRKKM